MKILNLLRSRKYGSIKRMILLVLLMIAAVVIFLQISWSYHSFEAGMGTKIAQVAIAYHVVLLLGMVAAGVGLGYGVDRMIRQKKFIFHAPRKGSWTETFMNLWGYELNTKREPETEPGMIEPMVLLDLPTRRGRKPTFPLERWLPITAKWENRDPIRDAFTLAELISEHLGTNSDGSPIVSEQTYYSTWRARAIAELKRRAKSKQSPATSE